MFTTIYSPETPQLLKQLAHVSQAEMREYLQICREFGKSIPPRNILELPYDPQVNPYQVLERWLEIADYQPPHLAEYYQNDLKRIKSYASLTAQEVRRAVKDSTTLDTFHLELINEFSQIYTVSEILNSLHIYNFYLQNYIHESAQARRAILEDYEYCTESFWHLPYKCQRLWQDDYPSGHAYNQWVRDTFAQRAITKGSAYYSQLVSHVTQQTYKHYHPIINPDQRDLPIKAYEQNVALAKKLRRYRGYRWIEPIGQEVTIIQEIKDADEYLPEDSFLLTLGRDHLVYATELAGQINHAVLLV